jgi:hypothetical protein
MRKIPDSENEEFFSDTARVFSEVLDFLGLPEGKRDLFPVYDRGEKCMNRATRGERYRFLFPFNGEPSSLLDIDIQDWI